MFSEAEERSMKKALRLARRGKGSTFPNPMVGAVVLDSAGEEAGDGFHRQCGAPHAEAVALSSAGEASRGGTMVVTLEPCCHHGRTGPCTDKIIEAGIARVVIAMEDPDERVCGSGIEQLQAAGIEVEKGLMEERARQLNRVYLHFLSKGRSWLTLKLALTLDGRTAASDGSSRWISCEASRKLVHRKRASVGAVMTGAGTVRRDDPELTVRLAPKPPSGQPLRIVVTSTGDLGSNRRIFDAPGNTAIAIPEGKAGKLGDLLGSRSVRLWEFPAEDDGGISLLDLLQRTADEGVGEILCEAGSNLSTRLLRSRLVDSVMIFSSPSFLGGGGMPALGDLDIGSMENIVRLRNQSFRRSGEDFLTEGEIVYGSDRG